MKKYVSLLLVITLFACNSSKKASDEQNTSVDPKVVVNEGTCPEAGTCSFQIKEGTSFTFETDGTGALYPKFEQGDGSVAEFSYKEKGPEGTADGDYAEVIQFNIPKDIGKGKSYTGDALQDVNLVFNKHCFCKGEAGYYKVTEGALKLFHDKDGALNFDLQFKMNNLTHTIHRIIRK
ncbi:MAG: hypothetical protein Aureis2KO_29240 [Aureisphaera sp.]